MGLSSLRGQGMQGMWRCVAWGVGRRQQLCALVVCLWVGACAPGPVCGCLCAGQPCPGTHRHCCSCDTPSAVCLQGNRGRLGVVVAAYMHYSNISAR